MKTTTTRDDLENEAFSPVDIRPVPASWTDDGPVDLSDWWVDLGCGD